MTLFSKIFRDKTGKVAVFQMPNIPLWIWIIATALTHGLRGNFGKISGYVALVAIIIWAGIEIWSGSSLFRRILGAAVLMAVVINRL